VYTLIYIRVDSRNLQEDIRVVYAKASGRYLPLPTSRQKRWLHAICAKQKVLSIVTGTVLLRDVPTAYICLAKLLVKGDNVFQGAENS
jgi:hypothetical protein